MKAIVSVLVVLVFAGACATPDAPSSATPSQPTVCTRSLSVVPATATLHVADTLRATADFRSCANPNVSQIWWRSSDATIATVDSVSGLISARGRGTAAIKATAVTDPALFASTLVTVVP